MVTSSHKVLFLTNIPSPYMVDFFNLLGKKIELTVVFERGQSAERNSNWRKFKFKNFIGFILKGLPTSPDSAFSPSVITHLFKKFDFIFISNPTTPTGILAIIILKLFRKKYVIFSEGAYPNSNRNIREFIKQIVLSNAWYYFSGNPSNDSYFFKYNKQAKIIRFPFSSVSSQEIVSVNDKILLKQKFIIEFGYQLYNRIAIMVGRFIPLKKFDLVIRSWVNVSSKNLLLLIGEGPELINYQKIIKDNNLTNVKILPFQPKLSLDKFYILSDFLIHPTSYDVWGLIINEAFAKGTPVLTTHNCLAAEVMLKDKKNGKFIDFKSKNFIDEVNVFFDYNELIMKNFSYEALVTAGEYTLEKMVEVHLNFMSNWRIL